MGELPEWLTEQFAKLSVYIKKTAWVRIPHSPPGYSVVWVSRLVWDQEIVGSNPATPISWDHVAQMDRATAF